MFFPERIISINPSDKVLEVGPGGTPFHRSDVLLEKFFNEKDAKEQRGHAEALTTEKSIVFYEGNVFPFKDKEFDYVICSHVLEHVPADQIEFFISELTRVAKKGYLEFPTIYYDYIYNFPKHLSLLLYENGVINYLGKEQTMLNLFHPVQKFFYHSASAGHTSLTNSLKKYFFQGFEWDGIVKIKKVQDINDVCYDEDVFSNIEKALSYEPISCRARLKNKAKSVLRFLNPFLIRNKIKEKRFSSAHKKWVARKGDNTHRLNYDLDCDSVVFDLGGYEGDFTDAIFRRYGCNIYVFEPVISFYNKIDRRFAGNEKIKVFNFGLSDSDKLLEINLDADGSSIFKVGNNKEVINLKDICSFIRSENLNKVDLMKINIEGGEFEVLPALITSNAIEIFKNIQVQFHDFIEGAENKRKKIRKGLEKTHYVTFNYWFVWEGWRRKSK